MDRKDGPSCTTLSHKTENRRTPSPRDEGEFLLVTQVFGSLLFDPRRTARNFKTFIREGTRRGAKNG